MRLFVGLTPPLDVVEHLEERVDRVRQRVPPPVAQAMRWIPPSRWHVTLAFLGDVTSAAVDGLAMDLDRSVSGHQSPELRLAAGGALSGNVIHVGVEQRVGGQVVSAPLADLASLTRRAVRAHGVRVERREYYAHLSVARFRARIAVDSITDLLQDYAGPWWRATEVELIESVLGAQPVYRTIASFPLASPADDDASAR